jgi:primosomal protein N' (replication factor Y)
MSDHIQLALPLPIDRTFAYRIPSELKERARAGCRAVVPFGRRILTGVIVDYPDDPIPAGHLRDVIDLPDPEPLLSQDILDLTYWIKEYYFCSWGETLKAALPGGYLQAGVRVASFIPDACGSTRKLNRSERALLDLLETARNLSVSSLTGKHKIPNALRHLRHLEVLGLVRIEERAPRGKISQLWEEIISKPEGVTPADLIETAEELLKKAPSQSRILRTIAPDQENPPAIELLKRANATRPALKALLAKGLVTSQRVQIKRYPTLEALTLHDSAPLPQPNGDQQTAIDAVTRSLEKSEARTFLLYGVTGSGKTLVYQKVIEQVLARGGAALVLIPEISLTPQLVGRFRACFGDRIGLQHSAMSDGERTDVWQGIRSGEFPIVIGARSALFAPLKNLQLIVVDEEGDPSFKQNEPNPRYNARDAALVRAKQAGAAAILGSATPSVESFHNARRGRYTLLELPNRVDSVPLPVIRFAEPPQRAGKALGSEMRKAISNRSGCDEQVILLHNRRGYFTYVFCPGCGYILRCRHCEITLTYHQNDQRLRCHFCGFNAEPSKTCPDCEGSLRYSGSGTQRVEEELMELLSPDAVARLDLDTTSRKGAHHRILKGFARGEQSVLLGTKMVARGHDYPRVTLVGILSADVELAFPDFRCDERSFALHLQAAGRAGRTAPGDNPGEVLVQTWMPEHPVLGLVKTGDYRAFFVREITLRRSVNYPPWGWMVLFVFSSRDSEKARQTAGNFAKTARRSILRSSWMGPTPAFRYRLKDRYRYQVILKTDIRHRAIQSSAHRALRSFIESFRTDLPTNVHMTVDVDPIQLL